MVYESVKHRVNFKFDVYESAVKDWDVLPLIENSIVIGGVLVKDNEIHVGYGVKPKSTIRPYIKSILKPMIEKYGFVVTSVIDSNEIGLRFCKRLGFIEIAKENGAIKLRCDRSNY